ncbi:MAG TPA: hypothetical protein DCR69_05790 [Clostridium sp.]|nr:hypothetical protein [Clostridium sp.]
MRKGKRRRKFIKKRIIRFIIPIVSICIVIIGVYFFKWLNNWSKNNEQAISTMANSNSVNLANHKDMLEVSRFTEENPKKTAISMCQKIWKSSDMSIIINNKNFMEGCLSLSLSKKYNAPILLNEGEVLSDLVKNEISRLQSTKIIIIGEENSITKNIENELVEKGLEVNRFQEKNSTNLSIRIAEEFKGNNTYILSKGDNLKEVMLLSYIGIMNETPVIISDNYLSTYKFLRSKNNSTIYFAGNEDTLYRTFSNLKMKKIDIPNYFKNVDLKLMTNNISLYHDGEIMMASSNNPSEFISACAASGVLNMPLIDVGSKMLNKPMEEFMIERGNYINHVIAVGNERAVSEDLLIVPSWGKFYTNAKSPLVTPTYDGSNQAVHPDVLYTQNGWNGYKYLMGLTPYPNGNDDYENPQILVSNDGSNFNYLKDSKNPLDIPKDVANGGHYSDINICLVDDILEVYFRYNPPCSNNKNTDNCTNMVYVMKSKDGIRWSDKELVLAPDTFNKKYDYVSPIIIYDKGVYKIWFSNYSSDLYYTETNDFKNFKDIQVCKFQDKISTFHLWHHDLIKTDLGYEIVINGYNNNEAGNQGLYYAVSKDGVNFLPMKNLFNPSEGEESFDNSTLYKSSLVRLKNRYLLYYSARSKSGQWRIGLAEEKDITELN